MRWGYELPAVWCASCKHGSGHGGSTTTATLLHKLEGVPLSHASSGPVRLLSTCHHLLKKVNIPQHATFHRRPLTHPYLNALSALSYGARLALRLADTTTSPAAALLLRPRRKKRKLAAVRRGVYTRRRAAATAAAEPWGQASRGRNGTHTLHFDSRANDSATLQANRSEFSRAASTHQATQIHPQTRLSLHTPNLPPPPPRPPLPPICLPAGVLVVHVCAPTASHHPSPPPAASSPG